jgi:hypothetical protein
VLGTQRHPPTGRGGVKVAYGTIKLNTNKCRMVDLIIQNNQLRGSRPPDRIGDNKPAEQAETARDNQRALTRIQLLDCRQCDDGKHQARRLIEQIRPTDPRWWRSWSPLEIGLRKPLAE